MLSPVESANLEPVTVSKNAASARKGRAVEHLVAAICVLASGGELNALTALVDDEGVDLGLKRRKRQQNS